MEIYPSANFIFGSGTGRRENYLSATLNIPKRWIGSGKPELVAHALSDAPQFVLRLP